MKRIYLVTGATGHLGMTICKKLVANGKSVRALVLNGDKFKAYLPSQTEIFCGDVTDYGSILDAFSFGINEELCVIHCAGIVSISSGTNKTLRDVNIRGTANVIRACKEKKVSKMVYVSSVHAIAEPKNYGTIVETDFFDSQKVKGGYAKTKAEATRTVLEEAKSGAPFVVVHPSGIIGPNDYGKGHLTQLILDYCSGSLKACVRGGYDFVDVRDVADGILNASEKAESGECFILSGHYATIEEVLNILHEITGEKRIKTVLPHWFVKALAPLCELYYKARKKPPLFTSYSMYTLSANSAFSNEKAKEKLGFDSRPLRETLWDTVGWLREQKRIK